MDSFSINHILLKINSFVYTYVLPVKNLNLIRERGKGILYEK